MGLVSGLYRVRFGVVLGIFEGLLRASSTSVSLCCGSGRQPRILPIRQDRREVYVRARVRMRLCVQAREVWGFRASGAFLGAGGEIVFTAWGGNGLFSRNS